MWAHLVAMLAYVGLRLIHVEPKDPKNGNSKKNTVKRRIFWWSAAYLGAMLAHLGAMLSHLGGYVAPAWGYVGPSWSYVGPSWGYVGPSWGWPILRPMLPHLEAYVGPCWPIRNHRLRKIRKNAKSTKHRKTRGFFGPTGWVAGRGRGPSLLRRGENCRTARTRPGGPWPDLSAYARQPARGPTM